MKEAFEIARIIQKSLKGQLSESEERQLSDWRKASGENERAFQRMISEDFTRLRWRRWKRMITGGLRAFLAKEIPTAS